MYTYEFLDVEWKGDEVIVYSFDEEKFRNYSPDGRLVIPKVLYGQKVVGIRDEVFANCESIKEIVLQEGLKKIGRRAFAGCVNVTKVAIPSSVEEIGGGAFNGIANLKVDPRNLLFKVVNDHFLVGIEPTDDSVRTTLISYLGNEKSPRIPNVVERLADYAFAGIDSVERVVVDENITSLGEGTFQDCKSLKNAALFCIATKIIPRATFLNCCALQAIHCSESPVKIERLAFAGCSSLEEIEIRSDTEIEGGAFNGFCGTLSFEDGASYEIKNDLLLRRGHYLVSCLKTPSSVVIPDGVKTIEPYAFFGSSTLESVKAPDSLYSIGGAAFKECSNLKEVELPNGLLILEPEAFAKCASLTEIVIPESVVEIKDSLFEDDCALKVVHIMGRIRAVGARAFKNCSLLEKTNLSATTTNLGFSAFEGCESLKEINLRSLISVIPPRAFFRCKRLEDVKFPLTLTSIEANAFRGCDSIKELRFPKSLQQIDDFAFGSCEGLERVDFPDGILALGECSFASCKRLKNVYIPSSVNHIGGGAFAGVDCHIELSPQNQSYQVIADMILTADGKKLLSAPDGIVMAELPKTVEEIAPAAFESVNSLELLTLPKKLRVIDDCAFFFCSSLEYLVIPDSVKRLGNGSFCSCKSLAKIIIGSRVESIDAFTLSYCARLKEVHFRGTPNRIEYAAFFSSDALEFLDLPQPNVDLDYDVFSPQAKVAVRVPT